MYVCMYVCMLWTIVLTIKIHNIPYANYKKTHKDNYIETRYRDRYDI